MNPLPRATRGAISLVLLILFLSLNVMSVFAVDIFIVDAWQDASDNNIGDGICQAIVDGNPRCTLRAALQEANVKAGTQTIWFSIPGPGVNQLSFSSSLPTITDTVFIDGYTELGATPAVGITPATINISIPCNNSGPCLHFTDDGNDVRGLLLYSGTVGIQLDGNNNTIRGNHLGVGAAWNALGGVLVTGANNLIGGTTAADRNIISGNHGYGVRLQGAASSGNRIIGNYIGVAPNGTGENGNADGGVEIIDADDNEIGGLTVAERNIISGNYDYGILIQGVTSTLNLIRGNYVGVDRTGTTPLGNYHGIKIDGAPSNSIGTTETGGGNVISDNYNYGVYLISANASGNTVYNNLIGLEADGSGSTAPNNYGVYIENAPNNRIGGTVASSGNTISDSNSTGVYITGSGATGNYVQGNKIGTNIAGDTAIGNGFSQDGGVAIVNASGNLIGGTTAGARNIISGNTYNGITIRGTSDNNDIIGNYIGVNAAGTAALPNYRYGIQLADATTNTTIGGTTAGARNIISGNTDAGIYVEDTPSINNVIQGNYIGTNAAGTAAIPNLTNGIHGYDAVSLTIGGTAAGAGNLISGNGSLAAQFPGGIRLRPSSSAVGNHVITGNIIGLNAAGTGALGNIGNGIRIDQASVTIGGTTAAARNVISANTQNGIFILYVNTTTVQGNYIGTNAAGTSAFGNTLDGVVVFEAPNNLIGGTAAGAGNVISGNGRYGVYIKGAGSTSNIPIQGNRIGTNAAGTADLGNLSSGIWVTSTNGIQIGGTTATARNVISGNDAHGIHIVSSTNPQIQGSFIGTNAAGSGAIPNTLNGIQIDNSTLILIGGTAAGTGNVISGNTGHGVSLLQDYNNSDVQGNTIGMALGGDFALANGGDGVYLLNTTDTYIGGDTTSAGNIIAFNLGSGITNAHTNQVTDNAFRLNSIYANGGMGIDLVGDGVTANDLLDSDSGLNQHQNFPLMIDVQIIGDNYQIMGKLDSQQSRAGYAIDFYANDVCDPSGYGEGRTYLGSTTVTTNAAGLATFGALTFPIVPGQTIITATATDTPYPIDFTSEFSPCAAPNLIRNFGFADMTNWGVWDAITYRITAGVFEFYRNVGGASAIVLQNTAAPLPINAPIMAQFDLGNISNARKRVTILLHDSDFSDLQVCSFWLPPNAALRTYRMMAQTTEAWTAAYLSVYASTADGIGWMQLDNVSLTHPVGAILNNVQCINLGAPTPTAGADGANLIQNGNFSSPTLPPWGTFGQITHRLQSSVFEFYRNAGDPAGVVLQNTGVPIPANAPIEATFQLGNISSQRMRVTVLLHASDFSDLQVCTFWLPANTPRAGYMIRTHTTQAWGGATLSVYPSTTVASGWLQLDDVVLRQRPSVYVGGTQCYPPGTLPSGFSAGVEPASSIPLSAPTLMPTATAFPYSAPNMPAEMPLLATPTAALPAAGDEGQLSENGG